MKKILTLFCILSFYGACAQIMTPQVYLGVSSGSIGDDRQAESAFTLTGACLAVRASNSIQLKPGLEFASYFDQERSIRQHSFQPYLDLWWKSDSVSKWSVFLGYGVNYYSLKIHNLEDNGLRLNELKSNWSLGMARMGVGFAINKYSSLWLRGSMRQKDYGQWMLEKNTWSIEAGYAYSFKSKQWKSPNIKPRTFSHYLSFAMGSQAKFVLEKVGKRENRFQSYYGIRLKLASNLAFIAEARILYIDNYDNGGENDLSGNGGVELSLPLMSFGNLNLRGLTGIAQNKSQTFRTRALELGCLTKFRMEFFVAYSIAKHPTFSDINGSLDYVPVYKTFYGGIRYYLNRALPQ